MLAALRAITGFVHKTVTDSHASNPVNGHSRLSAPISRKPYRQSFVTHAFRLHRTLDQRLRKATALGCVVYAYTTEQEQPLNDLRIQEYSLTRELSSRKKNPVSQTRDVS